MKKKGKIVKAPVAMPALACKMFLDSENETFYDDPSDVDEDPYEGVEFCKIAIQNCQPKSTTSRKASALLPLRSRLPNAG